MLLHVVLVIGKILLTIYVFLVMIHALLAPKQVHVQLVMIQDHYIKDNVLKYVQIIILVPIMHAINVVIYVLNVTDQIVINVLNVTMVLI